MRNVAVCGSRVRELLPGNRSVAAVQIGGYDVMAALIETRDPVFDPHADAMRSQVLIRVRGFSCNYRDMSLMISASRRAGENAFYAFGSDAVGEVLEVGADVATLRPGDRVISDNHYTGGARPGEGVLTNHASKELQIVPRDRLVKIPDEMPDEVAAAFSIGAQTNYAMLRRLDLKPGMKVLVTAAKSNTSLFAINALRRRGVEVYATSTSRSFERELRGMGVRELIVAEAGDDFARSEQMLGVLSRVGPFERVIDPFYDLHLHHVVELMAPHGRYVTCGMYEQFVRGPGAEQPARTRPDLTRVMMSVLVRNVELLGNCIGLTEDLTDALEDYRRGELHVCVDSVFRGDAVGNFLDRTYNAKERFGKVVYLYEPR